MFHMCSSFLLVGVYVCTYVCLYVCVFEGRASSRLCTPTVTDLLCFLFGLTLRQSHTSHNLQDLTYGGVIIITRLHKKLAHVTKP
jgi:hypothetical protein